MPKFKMICSCGDSMEAEANTREEAVAQLKGKMDEAAITAHMAEKHPGQPVMSVADCHAMIEKELQPA